MREAFPSPRKLAGEARQPPSSPITKGETEAQRVGRLAPVSGVAKLGRELGFLGPWPVALSGPSSLPCSGILPHVADIQGPLPPQPLAPCPQPRDPRTPPAFCLSPSAATPPPP